jgi:hypothetical protein
MLFTNRSSACALRQILSSYKKKSFSKYSSSLPRCVNWIEAQAAQYKTTLATQSTCSKPEFHLTASQGLHFKQTMRGIFKSSPNRARQTPRHRSKRRAKCSNRSCSRVALSSKGKDKDKDTLKNHQKAHSPLREPRERPGAWEKWLDKAAATWKRHQIVHSGPYRALWGSQTRGQCC